MITLLTIGRLKDKSMAALDQEYRKRISAFSKIEVCEVKDEANLHTEREAEVRIAMEKEAERALARIRPDDFVILLDLHGQEWTSEDFAARLGSWQRTRRSLVFVIAGSLGPAPALTARADVRWKLSSLTFTHLMTRFLVLEQIYRGFMILNNRTYHK